MYALGSTVHVALFGEESECECVYVFVVSLLNSAQYRIHMLMVCRLKPKWPNLSYIAAYMFHQENNANFTPLATGCISDSKATCFKLLKVKCTRDALYYFIIQEYAELLT